MKKSRFTEEQIFSILKKSAARASTKDLCRRHGISDQTFYSWKAKYRGMQLSELRKVKSLEDENRRLKTLLTDTMLENEVIKDLLQKF